MLEETESTSKVIRKTETSIKIADNMIDGDLGKSIQKIEDLGFKAFQVVLPQNMDPDDFAESFDLDFLDNSIKNMIDNGNKKIIIGGN